MEEDLKMVGSWNSNEDWRFAFGTGKASNIDLLQVEDTVIDVKLHDCGKTIIIIPEALKELYSYEIWHCSFKGFPWNHISRFTSAAKVLLVRVCM